MENEEQPQDSEREQMIIRALRAHQLSEGATLRSVEDLLIEIVARLRLLQADAESSQSLADLIQGIQKETKNRGAAYYDEILERPPVHDSTLMESYVGIQETEAGSLALLHLAAEILARLRNEAPLSLLSKTLTLRETLIEELQDADS